MGGFGGLFELPKGYDEPVLVSATDGVGTKLRLAIDYNRHNTVGIDLVAMCANDLIVCGAEPLFFLDYYGTAELNVDTAEAVIKGITEGCMQAGCALVGGETAELPSLYEGADYDLAGFCVGIVEKSKIIDPARVKPSDRIIGLPSSGLHSNGYSLVRKIIELNNIDVNMPWDESSTLLEELLTPTRMYVKTLLTLISQHGNAIHGLANITGGGITENLPRVLPKGTQATIDWNAWQQPRIFSWLQEHGNVAPLEMLRTFNCGIGFTMVVDSKHYEAITQSLVELKQDFIPLGTIEHQAGDNSGDSAPFVNWLNAPK